VQNVLARGRRDRCFHKWLEALNARKHYRCLKQCADSLSRRKAFSSTMKILVAYVTRRYVAPDARSHMSALMRRLCCMHAENVSGGHRLWP
jgi:hypothetical protein